MPKYKHQPTRKEIEGLTIEVKKRKGKIHGVTIWADGYWVLDASVMKDKDEGACRIFTGNRHNNLQFEYFEGRSNTHPLENYLELRAKKKDTKP